MHRLVLAWLLLLGGILCLSQQPRAQYQSFPPGVFGNKAALDPSGGGSSNVTVDQIGTEKYQLNAGTSGTPVTYTGLTITAALTNPGLVCLMNRADGSNNVIAGIAATWNSVSMAVRISQQGAANTSGVFIFGLRNPASGNHTLSISGTNLSTDNFVNCISFSNVNQSSDAAAFPNPTGSASASSLSITSSSGHIAVGVFTTGASLGTILTGSSPCNVPVYSDSSSGTIINAGADCVQSSGASTSVGTSTTQSPIAGMDVSN